MFILSFENTIRRTAKPFLLKTAHINRYKKQEVISTAIEITLANHKAVLPDSLDVNHNDVEHRISSTVHLITKL